MRLAGRLARLERALADGELRRAVNQISAECGVPPEEVFAEAEQVLDRLRELEAMGLSIREALRRWAEEEGLDPDEVLREAERLGR